MKKSIRGLAFILPAIFLLISSCDPICMEGTGPLKNEIQTVKPFSGIRLKVAGELIVEQGPVQEVSIEVQDNIRKLIKLDVKNETLEIENTECIGSNEGIIIHVIAPEINKLIISGSGKISSKGKLTATHMEFGVNGSGYIEAEVDVKSLYAGIKGSGEIVLKGNAAQQNIKVMGSGNYKAIDLATITAEAGIDGSGEISVYVLEKLKAVINGSGNIHYKGSPEIQTKVNGSGFVNKIE
jgi:hypothetical protein